MRELIVDSFAGGGGASTGIELALGRSPDVAINHDAEALALHAANHPDTLHLCSNVWQVDPAEVAKGRPVGLLWASPDCKHFSKAKGGKPVSRNIRDLAWVVALWAERARPRVIILENVEEFQDWGPLVVREDGREFPCPDRKGQTFKRFVARLKKLGYRVEWRELRACDYGAPTIRKRLFLIARRDARPIVWPEPTHGDPKSEAVRAGRLLPWRAAAEIIDWSLPCPSIFETSAEIFERYGLRAKRPLAEATMARIARGVMRYVVDAAAPFIVPVTHPGDVRVNGVDEPLRTQTAAHRGEHALVTPFVSYGQQGGASRPADEPLHTVTASAKDTNAVVAPFVAGCGGRAGQSPERAAAVPFGTLTAKADGILVTPFLARTDMASAAERNGINPPDDPLRTLTTAGSHAVVAPYLVPRYGERDGQEPRTRSVEDPASTVVPDGNGDQLAAVFLAQHNGDRKPTGAEYHRAGRAAGEPIPTITTEAQQAVVAAFLAQHNTGVVGHDARKPLSSIVAGGQFGQTQQAVVAANLSHAYTSNTCGGEGDPGKPIKTILTGNHAALVSSFLIKYYGQGIGARLDEATVAAGRMYDVLGAVYNRGSSQAQSMISQLAAAAQRIVSITAYGSEVETDVQERDMLVNVDTGATEPEAVAVTRSRTAVLSFIQGAESADPQPPPIPVSHVEIARVLVDTIQVVSVTMIEANRVASTEELDGRTDSLETFRTAIEPRVSSLASDLSALANQMSSRGSEREIAMLFRDMARVKERLEIPSDASDYGNDRFLTTDQSDTTNAAGQGYDCLVEEGARFPDANSDEFEMNIFSANDSLAKLSNGLLLPLYANELAFEVGPYHSDLAIGQYGYQTFDVRQMTMARQRLRYGSVFTVCSNAAWWKDGTYDSATNTFQKAGETFEVVSGYKGGAHDIVRLRQVWVDTYEEPYWDYVPVEHTIQGAQVAQSFLIANDMWATTLAFRLTVKAANEAVHLTLCECTNGQPDLSRAILHQTVPHGQLLINAWTTVSIPPTFLRSGRQYALVLTSNANHRISMASGQSFLDGTFFTSTDGAYFLGDLSKDMMLRIGKARFAGAQMRIELGALNLDGGIRAVDILAGMIVPSSAQVVFEVRPGGSGAWLPLDAADLTAFATTPPLAQFRARFVGTKDVHGAILLTGSRVKLRRPKTSFKHVSTAIELASASDKIIVQCLLEEFDETPHDFSMILRHGSTNESPDATTTEALPDLPDISGRYLRTFTFELGSAISSFRLVATGTTTSAGNTFQFSERVHWAL